MRVPIPTGHNELFDVHAHLPDRPFAVENLLKVMDEQNIRQAVVIAGGVVTPEILAQGARHFEVRPVPVDNAAVARACDRSKGRLLPFFFADPTDPNGYADEGDRYHGLKLAPIVHGVTLTDWRTQELVAQAQRFNHAVYLHCLRAPGFDVPDLVSLARRNQQVRFVLGHAGINCFDLHAVELISDQPNILLETSGAYLSLVAAAIRKLGAHRVLFGSEYPLQHPALEVAKYRLLDLTDREWHQVTWANAVTLMECD